MSISSLQVQRIASAKIHPGDNIIFDTLVKKMDKAYNILKIQYKLIKKEFIT